MVSDRRFGGVLVFFFLGKAWVGRGGKYSRKRKKYGKLWDNGKLEQVQGQKQGQEQGYTHPETRIGIEKMKKGREENSGEDLRMRGKPKRKKRKRPTRQKMMRNARSSHLPNYRD